MRMSTLFVSTLREAPAGTDVASAQLLTRAGFQRQLGADRPTETVIIDGLNTQWVTLMRFSDYVARPIPDAWLQRDYMPTFQPD